MLLRGVGTLRYVLILSDNYVCQVPICAVAADGLTIHAEKWFLGAGFLGAPPNSLITANEPRRLKSLQLAVLQLHPVQQGSGATCPGLRVEEKGERRVRGWRNTLELIVFEISNSTKLHPSAFHAYPSKLRPMISFFGSKKAR